MRLTIFSDYSLRVLMYLALYPERRATVAELAQAFGASSHHLLKVVQELSRGGLVEAARGRGGGVRLARAPRSIRIGELVRRSEGGAGIVECLDRGAAACRISPVCRLKGALVEAVEAFYARLDAYTLADLVDDRAPLLRRFGAPAPREVAPC